MGEMGNVLQVTRRYDCQVPCTMEEPIYAEMNPVGTNKFADVEEPIYEEMKPVLVEVPAPLKKDVEATDQGDVRKDQEEESVKVLRSPCGQELYPDIGRVQKFSEVAKDFPGKADPCCCSYCESLALLQDSDAESDDEDSGTDTDLWRFWGQYGT